MVTVCKKYEYHGLLSGYERTSKEREYVSQSGNRKPYMHDELLGWNRVPLSSETLGGTGRRCYDKKLLALYNVDTDSSAMIYNIMFIDKDCVENGKIKDKARPDHWVQMGFRKNEYEALEEHFKKRILKKLGFQDMKVYESARSEEEFKNLFTGGGIEDHTNVGER